MSPRWSSRQIPRAICSVRRRAIFKPTMWYLPLDRAKRVSFHRSVPMCRTTSVRCIRADTAIPANCGQALFSSWEAVHRVFESRTTCIRIAEKSTSAWGVIGDWRDATADATMHGGHSCWDITSIEPGHNGNLSEWCKYSTRTIVNRGQWRLRGRLSGVGFEGNRVVGPVKSHQGSYARFGSRLGRQPHKRRRVARQLQENGG